MIRARDLIERVFWTFIAAFLGSLLGAPLVLEVLEGLADVSIEISAWQAMLVSATFAGVSAAANVLLVIARWRLNVLPDPGAGLPGLPTGDDAGAITIATACLIVLAVIAVLWAFGELPR